MEHLYFNYRQQAQGNTLYIEDVSLASIAATYGTPTYVYSRAALHYAHGEFAELLAAHPAGKDALICYAVKANSNLAILDIFARLGCGFDIVSGGELARVLAIGADPNKIIFSGVGKSVDEINRALAAGIHCFNVESAAELYRINEIAAARSQKAPISLRINPDVDARTHPYISTGLKHNKFGIAYAEAEQLYLTAAALPHLQIMGLDCHIGSQILDPAPFSEALERLLLLINRLKQHGISLTHLDLGGGVGINYEHDDQQPSIRQIYQPLLDRLQDSQLRLVLEPGRRLVGSAGVLLTKVEYIKTGEEKQFAIVDAAMNDLTRPALYDAWHDVLPLVAHQRGSMEYDVVGPICESSDFIAKQRQLDIVAEEYLAVMSAGAYGMAMSSNYNSRPRAAEILVDGDAIHVIRLRETLEQLWAGEQCVI